MPSPRENQLYRALFELRYGQVGMDDVVTAIRTYQRTAHRLFDADASCVATRTQAVDDVAMRLSNPSRARWDRPLLASFLRNERTTPPPTIIVAPIQRRGRLWGALALAASEPFAPGDGRALAKLTRALSDLIATLDDIHARKVQERIERKLFERLRPQDAFYQLLHGIRSLTHYDHSSALLLRTATDELELVAEQAAWSKTKSRIVGRRIALPDSLRDALPGHTVAGFDRIDGTWRPWRAEHDSELARALAFHTEPDTPPEAVMVCVPLRSRDRLVGVLKVASRTSGRLGPYEGELLRRFHSSAAYALDNLQETETLRRDVVRAERKHAMVTVARGISHDINNALGSILPIVQQMRTEIEDGEFDAARSLRDLQHLETAMQTCRRVFAGLVAFARSRERPTSHADLTRAIENALAILLGSLNRQRIRLDHVASVEPRLVRGLQHEIEQLVLNLVTNACDAMPDGGMLELRIDAREDAFELVVRDDGIGMTAEQLRHCADAFFTTKPHGTGLGLSICHSIVQDVRGRIVIDSQPGAGTTVRVVLPSVTTVPEEPSS